MFAILTDVSPNFATVAAVVTLDDLAEALEDMGDADEVIPIAFWRPCVGDRHRVDSSEYIADPSAVVALHS